MTYGFKFFNNSQESILDDSSVKPWFLEQAIVLGTTLLDPAYYANLLNQTDAEGNPFSSFVPLNSGITSWSVYTIRYATPAAYKGFLLFNLPNTAKHIYYESQDPSNVNSYSEVSIRAYVPNTVVATAADIPKAYMFIGEAIPNAQLGSGYGVQIFNQAAQCMFDSNKRHLQPAQYPYILISDLSSKYNNANPLGPTVEFDVGELLFTSGYDMPSNPAFLLPGINRSWVYPFNGTWYSTYIPTLYKKAFNTSNLLRATPPTFRHAVSAPDVAGMYGPTSSLTRTIVVDATPLDQGYTSPELPQSYILTKNAPGIQESQGGLYTTFVITIYLTTSGVPNGTLVPYTLSGTNITASDFTSNTLTGSFAVSNNNATVYLTAVSDGFIEGTETVTLALNNGKASTSFTVTDAVSYSLSSFMTPEEGQSIAVTLTTQGLADGSTVPYTITGITQADLTVGTISGNFTISSNTSALEFRFARDATTEQETMRISVNNGTTFLDIPITDVPPGNEILTISPSTFQYNERTSITITGGTPNGSFEFTSVPQGIDPVYAWNNRWKPEYSTVGTQYFDENGNFSNPPVTPLGPTGSDLGGDPNATVNRTFWIFTTTTKNFRSFNYTITPTQTFSITGSNGTKGPLTISETSTGYFKVTTTNVPTGTLVYPKFINTDLNANDYTNSAASGVAVNSSGVANFTIDFTADQTTDGTKTGELVVQYPNGTTKDSYGVITVLDASQTPTSYSLTKAIPSGDTANEGTTAYFYLTTNSTANVYWVLEGTGITIDDIDYAGAYDADGNYYSYGPALYGIMSSTYYMLTIQFKNDIKTEGNETLSIKVKTGSQNGQEVASALIIIGDTSKYPTQGTPSGNPYCIGFNRYQNYHDGNGGTTATMIEANSLLCNYVPPASYSVSKNVATVNENGYIIFTIGLTSVPSGTQLWWDISGTNITTNDILYVFHDAQDGEGWFTPSGGSPLNNTFTVYGQTSYQVIIYPRSDTFTENDETATFNLRTGYSGGPSQASTTFIINDTSQTPAPVVYNEVVSIVSVNSGDYRVELNNYMTISVTGGMPFGSFSFEGTNNGDAQPTTFTGPGSLDGSGNFTNYITGATARGSQTVGDFRLWFKFAYNNNVRSARYQVVYDSGTQNGPEYCVGTTRYQNYNDGLGGTYAQVVATNSTLCGYTQQYTPARTALWFSYYNYDFQGDTWGMNGGRPGGAVTATIIDGPYTGFAVYGSFNANGQFRYPVGNFGTLTVGFYTINFTFPGQDAYYSASYRTIVAYFYVKNESAGEGGVIP
jgi:hypothetical protein